jgi:hypothetical protein
MNYAGDFEKTVILGLAVKNGQKYERKDSLLIRISKIHLKPSYFYIK